MTKKGKNLPVWNCHATMTKKDAYISNELQLQNLSLTFIHKINLSFQLPAFYLVTQGLQHYWFFGQANLYRLCGLWQMSTQISTNFLVQKRLQLLGCKTQSFQEEDNKDFRLVRDITTGESDFNQFQQIFNQLVIAAENLAAEQNLSQIHITTMSKEMTEQLKLSHRVVEIVARPNRKTFVTMQQHNVDKPESS